MGAETVPSVPEQVAATEATARAAKKRAAAPSFADLAAEFGEAGIDRAEDGTIKGYRYPQPKDDAERARLNERVYEMWNPHRKLDIANGGEHSARTEKRMVKVKTDKGVREVAPDRAERLEREHGVRGLKFGYSRAYSEAEYWKGKS